MRSPDPWEGIARPVPGRDLSARLVGEGGPHELFRARDPSGRRVLFLVHDRSSIAGRSLPKMAGLELTSNERVEDGRAVLALRLDGEEDAGIFARLCEDIIETVREAVDDPGAVDAFIGRTRRWHDLLKGSRRRMLGREEQLGLIGELHTLLHVLAPEVGIATAVSGWRGASGAPKDFELAGACIECKARTASSRAKVRITSEHQLADVPGHALVLLVHDFANAGEGGGRPGMDPHDAVRAVREAISADAPDAMGLLDENLSEAGYGEEDAYEVRVVHLDSVAYAVDATFPRIVPGSFPAGPAEVSYDLPLLALEGFRIPDALLAGLLTGPGRP